MRIPVSAPRLFSLVLTFVFLSSDADAETRLPADYFKDQQCMVGTKTWLTDGIVQPPNNVTFDGSMICNFYKRAVEMFTWLTSPVPLNDGGPYVFTSRIFH